MDHNLPNQSRPKISIMVITYNHEKYIAQTLESILMQETEYSYEIAVIEDCSTDRTKEIIMEYVKKYPDKVKPYFNKKNIGRKITQKNFYQGYFRLTGDYMAILEGDDYWTSPYKLQKQVSFLENNPDYVACAHNTIKTYEDKSQEPHRFLYYENTPPDHTIDALILLSPYFHTTTLLFRNVFRGAPLRHFRNKWSCEIFVTIAHAQFGKIRYFDEDMAVYRAHSGGRFSSMKVLEGWYFNIGGLRRYNQWLKYRYLKAFSLSIIRYCTTLLTDKGKMAESPTRFQYVKYFGIRFYYQMIYFILCTPQHLKQSRKEILNSPHRILKILQVGGALILKVVRSLLSLSKTLLKKLVPIKYPTWEEIKFHILIKETKRISLISYKVLRFLISPSMKNKIKNYESAHPPIKELRQLAAEGRLFTYTGFNTIKKHYYRKNEIKKN